jgi:hypothetical protein
MYICVYLQYGFFKLWRSCGPEKNDQKINGNPWIQGLLPTYMNKYVHGSIHTCVCRYIHGMLSSLMGTQSYSPMPFSALAIFCCCHLFYNRIRKGTHVGIFLRTFHTGSVLLKRERQSLLPEEIFFSFFLF